MERDKSNLEGGCACGAVRYLLASAPMFVHCCHCRDCQRQTGSAFVINALIETDRVALLAGALRPIAMPTDSGRPHRIFRCAVVKLRCGANTAESRLFVSSASAPSTTRRRFLPTCTSTSVRNCRG